MEAWTHGERRDHIVDELAERGERVEHEATLLAGGQPHVSREPVMVGRLHSVLGPVGSLSAMPTRDI